MIDLHSAEISHSVGPQMILERTRPQEAKAIAF